MSKPIAVGDLVCVVKPNPCGCVKTLGIVFLVTGFRSAGFSWCVACRHEWGGNGNLAAEGYANYSIDVWRLKRFDPPAESESTSEVASEPVTTKENV